MTVQLASLKATLDGADAFVARTAEMAAELDKLKAASAGAAQGTGQLDAAVGRSVSGLERLKRQTIEGYAASRDFYKGIQTWETALSKGRATTAEAEAGLLGLVSRYRMLPEATELASRGITQMANVASASQTRMAGVLKQQQGKEERTEKMNQWADRMLPAQITDITVGLATGQNPMMVLLQQGGQLKDMYGGVGNALKAVGTYALGLVNPFTVAGAAIAAFAYALHEGASESEGFTKALALTGNYAGMSVNEMYDVARAIDNVTGTTKGAVAALTAAAGTGKITGANLRTVATAAEEMRSATGKAVDDTVAEFARIADDPVKAIEQLNETMHFLNAAEMEHIRTLVEHGDKMGAASIATDLYAGSIATATGKIRDDLGLLERVWNSVGRAASEAWDAMLDIGRPKTLTEQISGLEAEIDRRKRIPAAGRITVDGLSDLEAQLKLLRIQKDDEDRMNTSLREGQQIREASVTAEQRMAALRERTLTNAEKRQRELLELERDAEALRKVNPNSMYLDPAYLAAQKKAIEDKYKDPAGPATHDDAATKMLIALKEREASLRAQSDTTQTLTEDERKLVEFNQTIADLKTKEILTAEQKSLLASEDRLRKQYEIVAALSRENEQRKRIADFDAQMVAQEARRQGRIEQYQRELGAYGRGDRERQRIESERSIRREYTRAEGSVESAYSRGGMNEAEYRRELSAIQSMRQQDLADLHNYYAESDRAAQNWSNGASRAIENYRDNAMDIAGATERAFSNAFSGMEDALVEFVQTGKLDFQSLADSIIADLIRIQIRAAISGLLGGGSSGGGMDFMSLVTSGLSLLGGGGGSMENTTRLITAGGGITGRAIGGPTTRGSLYEVNERGPELYTTKGRTYLMAGGANGYVTPVSNDNAGTRTARSGSTVSFHNTFSVSGDGVTETQVRRIVQESQRQMDAQINRDIGARNATYRTLRG